MSDITRRKWTDEEFAKLIEMKKAGKDIPTIAKLLGRSPMSVSVKCSTIGVSFEGTTSPVRKVKSLATANYNKIVQDLWFNQHKTVDEIAEITRTYSLKVADTIRRMLGEIYNTNQAQSLVNNLMDPENETGNMNGEPFFWDQKEVPENPSEMIAAYENMRKQVIRYERSQSEVTAQIDTDLEWIAIVMSGDYHIGHMTSNLSKIEEDHKVIADTPGMYHIFMGDAIEGYTRTTNLSGLHEQILSPKGCRKLFDYFMSLITNKILGIIRGCHDDFAVNATDSDHIEELALKAGKPYLGYGGKINLVLNSDTMYQIVAWHKRAGNSYHNIFYPCMLYLQRHDMNADVVAIAHNHVVGITTQPVQERQRVFIRTGVYKDSDRYTEKLGYKAVTDEPSIHEIPVVLLNTKKKEMRIAHTIAEAAILLKAYNEKPQKDLEPRKKSNTKKPKTSK